MNRIDRIMTLRFSPFHPENPVNINPSIKGGRLVNGIKLKL